MKNDWKLLKRCVSADVSVSAASADCETDGETESQRVALREPEIVSD